MSLLVLQIALKGTPIKFRKVIQKISTKHNYKNRKQRN